MYLATAVPIVSAIVIPVAFHNPIQIRMELSSKFKIQQEVTLISPFQNNLELKMVKHRLWEVENKKHHRTEYLKELPQDKKTITLIKILT